jgi:hypothetical protein
MIENNKVLWNSIFMSTRKDERFSISTTYSQFRNRTDFFWEDVQAGAHLRTLTVPLYNDYNIYSVNMRRSSIQDFSGDRTIGNTNLSLFQILE